ncbi:hypothetical protein GC207_11995 [bacterium]|nr:hypothetical protein [bacterium]
MKIRETIRETSRRCGVSIKSTFERHAIKRLCASALRAPLLIDHAIVLALLVSLPVRAGELEQFFYSPIDGTNVVDLTSSPEFPEQPFIVTPANWFSTGLEGITNASTYYGSWLRGYLETPVSGAYIFYLSADDTAELYLSTDHLEADKQLIAKVTTAVPEDDYREQPGQKSAAIDLERGRQYYFEIRHKQGAGADHVQVGWLRPDDVLERPIPLRYVQRFVPASYRGPQISLAADIAPKVESFDLPGLSYPPAENQHVIIAANVSALPPVYYQWFKNGVPMDGENLSSLDLGTVSEANSGDVFNLLVATGNGIALSEDFPLRVRKDTTPPTLLRAAVLGMTNGFVLTFSEPVDPATATDVANYTMNLGITVTDVSLLYGTNLTTVVVRTSPFPAAGIPEVTVNNVQDLAKPPNVIVPDSTKPISSADGRITLRYYGAVNGGMPFNGISLGDIQGDPRFPDHPDLETTRGEFGIPNNFADNYAAQLVGYLVPPVSGDYRFFIASDDMGTLYLSTDADPAHKRVIAVEPQWNGYRVFTSSERRTIENLGHTPEIVASNFPSIDRNKAMNDSLNTVGLIHLDAGQRYYIEGLMMEGGGGDNLDVAWQMPGGPPVVDGQAPIPGEFLARWAGASVGDVAISYAPTNAVVLEGRRATFSVHAQGTEPFTYQWYRDGKRIVDVTDPSYTFPVRLSDDGAHYSVRVRNDFSERWSSEAVLTVTPDHEPPHIVRASADQYFDKVTLRFDEPVAAASATNAANYVITHTDNGQLLHVNSVELGGYFDGGYTNIILHTDTVESGENYTVRTTGVEDLAQAANGTRPEDSAAFTGWVLSRGFVLYEQFNGIPGFSVAGYAEPGVLPDEPTIVKYLLSWESEYVQEPYSVGRLSGFFIPPGSGRHEFYMSSQWNGELWLSTGDNSASPKTLIATEPWYGDPQSWTGAGGYSSSRNNGDNNTLGDNLSVLNMTAGEPRYMELLWKGNGYGRGDATYSGPNEPVPANGTPSRLTGGVIGAWANPDAVTIGVTDEPTDVATSDGTMATFSVAASAIDWDGQAQPVLYQWQVDDVDIPGATSSSFTTSYLAYRREPYHCRCRLSSVGVETYTREAVLQVGCDDCDYIFPGTARSDGTHRRVTLTIGKFISTTTATNMANYHIDGLVIESIEVSSSSPDWTKTIILNTSLQQPSRRYVLSVDGLVGFLYPYPEVHGWQLPFVAWTLQPGWVLRETWTNVIGTRIADLTSNSRYPDQPDKSDFLPAIESPPSEPNVESFGVRLSGWLRVTNTDDYLFVISGDDQAVFYLSTDESPSHKRAIVSEPEWGGPRDWNSTDRRISSPQDDIFPDVQFLPVNRSENTTGPIRLVEGASYYFEALEKEGGGGDHVEVTFYPAGSPPPLNGTPGIPGSFVWNYLDPVNLQSMSSPDEVIALPGWDVKFNTSAAVFEQPLLFQWERNGVPLVDKTNSVLEIPSVALSMNGDQYRCRIMAPGVDTRTAPARLTVLAAPQMVRQQTDLHRLKFSWPSDGTPHLFQTTTNLSPPINWQTRETLDQDQYLYQWTYDPTSSGASPQLFFRIIPEVSPP